MIFQVANTGVQLFLLAATFLTLTQFWRFLKHRILQSLAESTTAQATTHVEELPPTLETTTEPPSIETRIRARMAMLDRIAWEADQEIDRLQNLLSEVQHTRSTHESAYRNATQPSIESLIGRRTERPSNSEVTVSEKRTIINLDRAGFLPEEIANYMDLPADKVAAMLADNEQRVADAEQTQHSSSNK